MTASERGLGLGPTGSGVNAGRDANLSGQYVAGRDLNLTVFEGPAFARLPYRHEIGQLLTFYTRVFVGRVPELDQLAEFASKPQPGYLLIEAPPGYGKSALMAQLVHRHETGWWAESPPALVTFFIREAGNRHTAGAFVPRSTPNC
jgi:hypothetical protein